MSSTSRAYGSSGVLRDFLWLCSRLTCSHLLLSSCCSTSRTVTSSTLPWRAEDEDEDTAALCRSHGTSSHMQDSCRTERDKETPRCGACWEVLRCMLGNGLTLVNHRKSCVRELPYESSTSTMGIWSSAVTSRLSLW
ncbi:hypothetical protein EYF80_066532 [Liparis tanakae]|uniref:Uncharacterized protein n=1 Tax=Liparis tanakae TaxID=230148 RepID=A0A4Z2E3P4_9TELE|nr:hypothetical protein EYF80_066532 [Liparis tanakae]